MDKAFFLYSIVSLVPFSYLYQIAHLGDDDDEPEFSSAMPLEEGDTFFFAPRPLRNLVLVDEMESLSPIMGSHIADLGTYIQICENYNDTKSYACPKYLIFTV